MEGAFGGDVDYAQLVKLYGNAPESMKGRYSPAECIGAKKERVKGNPDWKHVSTSYAERQNLSMRMHMRRFHPAHQCLLKEGREPHAHGGALHRVLYWARIHKTLRVTPAMEAGLTDRLWSMEDFAELIEAAAPKPGRPATYKKRKAALR